MLHAHAAPVPADMYYGKSSVASSPTPQAIRMAAATLVIREQLPEARNLVANGLIQHPDSEDLLVMQALICEMGHDWVGAATALEHLIRVQDSRVPAETWCHWVRVLRCLGDWNKAAEVAKRGLAQYPENGMLLSEWQTLNSEPRQAVRRTAA